MPIHTSLRRSAVTATLAVAAALITGCVATPAQASLTPTATTPAHQAAPAAITTNSIVLPISSVTPGAVNPAVTQANINTTICKSGYTATIRPSSSYTTGLKKSQLATSYASFAKIWGTSTSGYEEDHLISLELGGAASDPRNLWPEPYTSATGARIKDKIETKLKTMICNGSITLVAAQKAIATNWYAAYVKYAG